MTYTLYYKPAACSMAVHTLLNELGVPYQAIKQENQHAPEFLKLNPLGQVPVLMVEGQPITECAAIMLYLLDAHPNKLMLKSGLARALALKWLIWGNATLHPAIGRVFWLRNQGLSEQEKATLLTIYEAEAQNLWNIAEERLAESKYLAGEHMTMADIFMTVAANWKVGKPGPNTMRVIKEVNALPSFQKTLAEENVTYKVAA